MTLNRRISPHRTSVFQGQCPELVVRAADVHQTIHDDRRRQHRLLSMIFPFHRAVRGIQSIDIAVSTSEDQCLSAYRGSRIDLSVKLS